MIPFFSVCIPAYNREKTIFNTLTSLTNQLFKDFEVKIVDCGSKDKTRDEINRFFTSSSFKNSPFNYEYIYRDNSPKTVEDWNEPVKLAKGKYIAMLEGDDQFLPNNLYNAYQYLSTHTNIGIYATGNNYRPLIIQGFMGAKDYFNFIYSLKCVPPPSQAIFIRKNQAPYYYNDKDFVYAPEVDLYLRISNDGLDAFHDNNDTVYRYPSSVKLHDSWLYYHDHFLILRKYKNPQSLRKIRSSILAKIRLMISITSCYRKSNSEIFKSEAKKNCGFLLIFLFLLMSFFYRIFCVRAIVIFIKSWKKKRTEK